MKKLFLIDAYALIFKYYYAFYGRPMRNRAGMNTSIVFGFTKFLRDIQKREKPDLLGVAFDPAGGSFRREMFEQYKANRPETPEDILRSVPYVKRIVEAMCVPILEVEGYEADDVIGTLAFKGAEAGYEVYMVTPDKDYGQLVGQNRKIYKQKGDQIEIIDSQAIKDKYGIDDPMLVSDILALWGDASDNIPGVAGIGEKGACKLVQRWGDVESIIANVDQITGRAGANIAASIEQLRLSKALTKIALDVPIEFNEAALTVCCPKIDMLKSLFTELDFKVFLNDVQNMGPVEDTSLPRQAEQTQLANMARMKAGAARRKAMEGQGTLFDMFDNPIVPTEPSVETPAEATVVEQDGFATIATVEHSYTTVMSECELRKVVDICMGSSVVCFDIETSGLDIFTSRIVGISLAIEPHKAWYIPFTVGTDRNSLESSYAAVLRPLFESEKIAKVGQNMKFDILFLRTLGIEVRGEKWDTMLLHYLLDPEARHNMDALSERYLNYSPISIQTLIGKGREQMTMDMVGLQPISEYGCEDADITLQLYYVLREMVESQSLMRLYHDIEEPMIAVLADMEWNGVKIDSQRLRGYSATLTMQLRELEQRICQMADTPGLNVNSGRQIGELLFAKMRIADKPKMTKTKQFCTDEEYLKGFAAEHEIVRVILEYRGVKKLLSTYIDALPELVNPVTGHIHTSYNQAVTATGRLSSSNPNLQNIPVRDAIGRPIREAFIPSREDGLLLSADYSQVELRLMAHLSGDELLCEAFRNGEDIHAATAAKIFGKAIDEVTTEERRRAKTANFGIIYGISPFGLAQRLDIPRSEAKALIDGYFASYPKVKQYMERTIAGAVQSGWVETIFARRRYLEGIDSRNANTRALAERNAINAPIQGSAADIMKIAMVGVYRAFKEQGIRSKLILQVHDEIVVDLVPAEREVVESIVREQMEGAAKLSIPLVVDIGVGKNWLEAH
ncbi:MAG: DNA polymerase I [Rikenellaceae bacterium]|nr:DNA polymerase I [Rikenellaceae bacterium]